MPARNSSTEGRANVLASQEFCARVAPSLLRWALAVTFLSAVADRFGIWGPPGTSSVSWGDWSHFVAYTAKVNSFLPAVLAPTLAVTATAAELVLGVALILGVYTRPAAWASTILLALFCRSNDPVVRYQGAAQLFGFCRLSRRIRAGRLAGDSKPVSGRP